MGLTEVINDVRRDGEQRAQELLEAARADAERIVADARAAADAQRQSKLQQADKDATQLEAQILSSAEFEARKLVLGAEAELRAELKATLLEGFAALKDASRKKHITALLKTAKDIIPKGSIHGAAKDEAHLKAQRGFTYGGAVDIIGGIIVESEDGQTRLDLSYETLLGDLWRDVLRAEAGLFN